MRAARGAAAGFARAALSRRGLATAATNLAEAHDLRKTATRLLLSASEDLLCRNLMCEKLGKVRVLRQRVAAGCCEPGKAPGRRRSERLARCARPLSQACVCRLALATQRMRALEEVDVSHNTIDAIPPGLVSGRRLRVVDASHNDIGPGGIPYEALAESAVEDLWLHGNPRVSADALDAAALAAMPALRRLSADGDAASLARRVAAARPSGAPVVAVSNERPAE